MAVLAAGWWGDFIGWLEGHEPSALVAAAFLTFLVTGILVGVTALYAKKTADIAAATERQAGATVNMAEEMRQQRLDADRPYLLMEVLGLEQIEWQEQKVAEGVEPDAGAAYPRAIACRISNDGRGPAKEIVVTLLHPLVSFQRQKKDVLRPGHDWTARVEPEPLVGWIHEASTGEPPLGMEGWMKSQGVDSRYYGDRFDCGLMVTCADIHDRWWATYSKFTLFLIEVSTMGKPVIERVLKPVEQRIVQLSEEP